MAKKKTLDREMVFFICVVVLAILVTMWLFYLRSQMGVKPLMPARPIIATQSIQQESAENRYSIDIAIPQVEHLQNHAVEQAVNAGIADIINQTGSTFKEEILRVPKTVPSQLISRLTFRYEVIQLNNNILSLLFSVDDSPAGVAHPNSYTIPFNYDIVHNRTFTMADVLNSSDALAFLSSFASASLHEQLHKGGYAYDSFIQSGTAPKKENFQKFVVSQTALILIFDPAHVAPAVAGVQRVFIPFDVLKKHNLLTQAFKGDSLLEQ